MNGHLPKPISMDQLRIALSRCLDWKIRHGRDIPPQQEYKI